jgi:hypothetical protein
MAQGLKQAKQIGRDPSRSCPTSNAVLRTAAWLSAIGHEQPLVGSAQIRL